MSRVFQFRREVEFVDERPANEDIEKGVFYVVDAQRTVHFCCPCGDCGQIFSIPTPPEADLEAECGSKFRVEWHEVRWLE